MKKSLVLFLLAALLLLGCGGTNVSQKEKVVRVLLYRSDNTYELQTHYRKDGDFAIDQGGRCTLVWEKNGCAVFQTDLRGDPKSTVLTLGEPVSLVREDETPATMIGFCCYCNEDDPLPEEWKARLESTECIQKTREDYGSYYAFESSRYEAGERAIVEQAITDAGLTLDAYAYCDFFYRALWLYGDTDVRIERAAVTPVEGASAYASAESRCKVSLFCSDGNEYIVTLPEMIEIRDGSGCGLYYCTFE